LGILITSSEYDFDRLGRYFHDMTDTNAFAQYFFCAYHFGSLINYYRASSGKMLVSLFICVAKGPEMEDNF